MITSSNVPVPNRKWPKNPSPEELDMLNEGGVDFVEVVDETDSSQEDLGLVQES